MAIPLEKPLPIAPKNILPEVIESLRKWKIRIWKHGDDPQVLVKMNSRSWGMLVKGELEGLKLYISFKK